MPHDIYGKSLSHLFDKPMLSPINLLYHINNIGLSVDKLGLSH